MYYDVTKNSYVKIKLVNITVNIKVKIGHLLQAMRMR